MFDISSVSKRYFGIKLTVTDESDKEHNLQLEVEPCRLKTMKKLIDVSKDDGPEAIDDLYTALQKLLSKNKSKLKVPMEYIEDLSFDELQAILTAYFEWLVETKNSDPN